MQNGLYTNTFRLPRLFHIPVNSSKNGYGEAHWVKQHPVSFTLLMILVASFIGGGIVLNWGSIWNSLSTQKFGNPSPPNAGALAYCPANQQMMPINLPTGNACQNVAQTLSITPQLLGGVGGPATFSIGTFEKTTGVGCKIFQNTGGVWAPVEFDQASSSGVCTTSNTYLPGSQITVEVCEDDSSNCVTGDYLNTQTVMYCPLPSIAAAGTLCNTGPGSGYVPFWVPSGSTTIQYNYYMPFVAIAGDDPNGQNSGTAQGLFFSWINGTQVSSTGATCFVSSGTHQCDIPVATSTGRFPVNFQIQPKGTYPASPQSFGYNSFRPVDPTLQTGTTARGTLNYVLVIEIKATTNNDMCTITGASFSNGAITPVVQARSGSATDILYMYVIPDQWITHSTDASGNVLSSGSVQGTLNLDCSQVYNGSGDVVGIAATQWAYASTQYIQSYLGAQINPEAVKVGGSADAAAAFGTVSNGLQIKT